MIYGRTSKFLTDIARDLDSRIASVLFGPADQNEAACLIGVRSCAEATEYSRYEIWIDNEKLRCPYQMLFATYHEVGHLFLKHIGPCVYSSVRGRFELEADTFAFSKMDMIGPFGIPKKECATCCVCLGGRSRACLKGYDHARPDPNVA
jgi:hypothetical protein